MTAEAFFHLCMVGPSLYKRTTAVVDKDAIYNKTYNNTLENPADIIFQYAP